MRKQIDAEPGGKTARGRPRKYSDDILVDAALRVMEREGYAALSVRSLAKEVGTTHATLYNYIGSIEEVEAKALHRLSQELPLPGQVRGPQLRIEFLEYLRSALRLLRHHPGIMTAPPGSAAGKALTEISDQWQRALQPHVADPKAQHLVLGLITSALLVYVTRDLLFKTKEREPQRRARQRRDAAEMEPYVEELIDVLLPGMAAPRGGRR